MERIERARENYLQSRMLLQRALDRTPEDRLTWKPSPSARSILEQVVHCAHSLRHMHETMQGVVFAEPTSEDADRYFRGLEQREWTLVEALDLFDRNGGAFLQWLDTTGPSDLERQVVLPFGMGQVPVSVMIQTPGDHTRAHVAQIEYIHTIYGDRKWLFP